MNMHSFARLPLMAAGLLAASLLAGCASSPKPRMYVFNNSDAEVAAASRDANQSKFIVRGRTIRLPEYLDRPQMVTRVAGDQISADEFNRWGIPLSRLFGRELSLSVMSQLPDAFVDMQYWRGQDDTAYLVDVNVVRLDGKPGGSVDLEVQWQVAKPDQLDRPLAMRLNRYQRKAADDSYSAYVEAVRLLVNDLGNDISAVIKADQP